MFGGWTAAITRASIMHSAETSGLPSAMTVNFIGAITPGEDVVIETQLLGGGRSVEHWRADLRSTSDLEMKTSDTVILANRRATDGHSQRSIPDASHPETLDDFQAPGRQGEQTLIRPISGEYASGDQASLFWVRELSGRHLDHVQLAYLADQYAPRSSYWGPGPRPAATLTMSIYFHGTADEIAESGDDYLMNEATDTRGEQSTSGQQAILWSRRGVLLATTEQLSWYR